MLNRGVHRVAPQRLAAGALLCFIASACADAERIEDISYDDRYGERTLLDLYVPNRPLVGALGSPAILLIHGGGWRLFSKDVYIDQAYRFAHAGYVVASMSYRLAPDDIYPAAIQDSFCALGFLQANAAAYGIDPERITVSGYSAGGHLASMIAVAQPTGDFAPDCPTPPAFPPLAVVSGAGPQNLRDLIEVAPLTTFLGGSSDEFPERYERGSPVTHVASGAPPFLLIHGTDDLIVPIGQAKEMRDSLREVGTAVRLLKLRGGHHLFNPDGSLIDTQTPAMVTDGPEAWAATMDFLREVNAE